MTVQRLPTLFVRPGWWHYKMPPPIMLLTLLLADRATGFDIVLALVSLVAVIALVCNFGYAINELYDVAEDARIGKENIATTIGAPRVALIAGLSAGAALVIALLAIGGVAAALTFWVLLLPLMYSAPPLRLKARRWLGVLADALAAHVYPVLLCLIIASHWPPHEIGGMAVAASVLWSLMLGLRGILAHQLLDEDRDRIGGLTTVVHVHGAASIVKTIKYVIAPIEIGALLVIVWLTQPGPIFWAVVLVYVSSELLKIWGGWRAVLLSRAGSPHLPFFSNAFYEVWGPLAALLDLGARQPPLLPLALLYVLLFRRRSIAELTTYAGLARSLMRTVGARLSDTRRG
jgi:4-hydroxybenzoate polyprenyltransferase